jgi:hypothetical protein
VPRSLKAYHMEVGRKKIKMSHFIAATVSECEKYSHGDEIILDINIFSCKKHLRDSFESPRLPQGAFNIMKSSISETKSFRFRFHELSFTELQLHNNNNLNFLIQIKVETSNEIPLRIYYRPIDTRHVSFIVSLRMFLLFRRNIS